MQLFNYQYTDSDALEVPSVNFIRQCRIYAYIVNDILAAIRLGNAIQWPAIYHDGTNRRQCSLYNLLIALEDKWADGNGNDSPMIVSSCIVMMDGTAKGIGETIKVKVCIFIIIVIILLFFCF